MNVVRWARVVEIQHEYNSNTRSLADQHSHSVNEHEPKEMCEVFHEYFAQTFKKSVWYIGRTLTTYSAIHYISRDGSGVLGRTDHGCRGGGQVTIAQWGQVDWIR